MNNINAILNKDVFTKQDVVELLNLPIDVAEQTLKVKAQAVQSEYVGKKVYFRGLIEYSNLCTKNCLYCGIRKDNTHLKRYTLTDTDVIEAVRFAYEKNYGSIVIQSGEIQSPEYTNKITELLKKIGKEFKDSLRITLSLGEQTEETYKQWFEAGATRYLLRIETSNKKLYSQIHPNDAIHDFDVRRNSLALLKKVGYHVGSGIMFGLPGQSIEDIASDLLFLRDIDIDMCGMGPYLEQEDTPLYSKKETLLPQQERFNLAVKAIAILRIMMKDINIASATALQAIDPEGREKAFEWGTNVIMPNLTPTEFRESYKLYDNKPCVDEDRKKCQHCLEMRIRGAGYEIGYGEAGDSKHYLKRVKK
jgi:biotin synthase